VCGALVAYTVHALYDWDWDIPGLTLPVLVLAGVLATAVPRASLASPPARRFHAPARVAALALAIIGMGSFAASAILPSVASSDASSALVAASGTTLRQVQQAESQARTAGSLDPLSDAGPRAGAVVAEHRGDLALARAYLIEALRRQPSDADVWASLAYIDLRVHRPAQALTAARNIIRLDPMNTGLRGFAYAVEAQAHRQAARP
jgi:tetratricopeptide (TPR) repeat protein